jgi:RNA polymerase sigma-70 factor (ECF subfamily)
MARGEDESKLIKQSLEGDSEAYAELVNLYQKMARAVAFRMTGSIEDSEELAQEAFVRGYRQLGTFQSGSKFSTWLCRIVINLSLDWRGREKRREAVQTKWAEQAEAEREPSDEFPDELSRQVQLALDRLPLPQRAAIVLTVYESQSHAEAAKTLGCAEATISWRVFAARRKLKQLLRTISHEQR